jgi:hypothetical protein
MYKIVGADQKEYGPVAEEQLRQWIAEGRANGQTLARFGDGPWKPLSTFPEFASALGTLPPPPTSTSSGAPPPPLSSASPTPLASRSSSSPAPTCGMAITGLVCSLLGLFCCGPLFSTLGLVFSALAFYQINQDPMRYGGKIVALAGILLALAGYAIFFILLFTGFFRRAFRQLPRRFQI